MLRFSAADVIDRVLVETAVAPGMAAMDSATPVSVSVFRLIRAAPE